MSIDEQKTDSLRILPKLNWKIADKEKSFKINKHLELFRKNKNNNFQNFGLLKPIVKRTPTNFHLIKVLKLKNEDFKENNNIINRKNLTPFNLDQTDIINSNSILDQKFSLILKKTKFYTLKSKTNEKLEHNKLNKIDVYDSKNKINNNEEIGHKSAIIRNKLIANKILNVRLYNKAKFFKKKLYRNKNFPSLFSPSSAYISFKKEANNINKSMINLNKNNSINLDNSSKSMTNIDNSLNSNGSTNLSPHLSKNKRSKEKAIFISKLNIKTKTTPKHKNLKSIKYIKKWELPKSFSFEKLTGRVKEIKSPIKLKILQRLYEYTPNYDSILCNDNKAYVKYNPDLNQDFKQYKKYKTRKFVYNNSNIINNPGNNYNIINMINERKIKERKKIDEKKLLKIMEDFIYNYKKNYNLK